MHLRDAVSQLNHPDRAVRDAAMAAVLQARGAAVPALIEALAAPGAAVAKIALLLAALKAREGIAPLVALLHKGLLDVDARAVVARAFAELMDGRDAFDDVARRAVLTLSRDGHTTTRQLSIKALLALGDGDSERRLQEMAASDADPGTRTAALEAGRSLKQARSEGEAALAQLAAGAPPEGEEGGLTLDLEAAVREVSGKHGVAVVGVATVVIDAPSGPHAALVVKLRDPRWATRGPVVEEAVALAGGPGRNELVATLVDVLAGTHPGAKIGAAQALARIQAPEAARALLELVVIVPAASNDDEKQLRAIALKALACSLDGSEEGFAQPLLPLVRDADPFVRAGALLCLGRLADRVGARAATVALMDPHDHVVEAAAVALSEGTREEDVDLVLPLLAVLGGMPSPAVAVREAILLALSRITLDATATNGGHDGAALLRLRHRVRPSVLGMTSSLRRTAIAILERCYTSEDPAPLGVIDDVLGRLADQHPEVRLLAASFLAQHLEPGMTGAVEKIEDALDRQERSTSLLCLEALRRHDTAKAKAALQACADDADATLAARAQELLVDFAPQTAEWSAASASAAEPALPLEVPARRGRVRAVVAGSERGDVVDAKDDAGLQAQLAAVDGADLSEAEKRARRAAILDRFT